MSRNRVLAVGVFCLATIEAFLVLGPVLPHAVSVPVLLVLADLVAGFAFVSAGLLGAAARPSSRVGALMVLVGLGSLLHDLLYVDWWPAHVAALVAGSLYVVALGQLFLTFPTGRFGSAFERWFVYAIYVSVPVGEVAFLVLFPATSALCPSCPAQPFGLSPHISAGLSVMRVLDAVWSVALVVIFARVAGHWFKAATLSRRAMTPILWAVGPVFVLLLAVLAIQLVYPVPSPSGSPSESVTLLVALTQASFALLPIGFLIGLLRTRLDRSAVGDLAIQLSNSATPETVESSLRRVFRDPSLRVLYWVPALDGYRDGNGMTAELRTEHGRHVESVTSSSGDQLAAVIYENSPDIDGQLVKAGLTVARMALDNARLHAEVKAQLVEVRAASKRMVEAGDAERRRIERDLHDGAQQRLVTLALGIKMARDEAIRAKNDSVAGMLAESGEELRKALEELRELARGIHPAILSEAGLVAALRSLADRSHMPVVLTAPDELPPISQSTASTLYFVASEALVNAIKHSEARQVEIRLSGHDGRICLEVSDDGVGGARPEPGSGLSGLSDRVAAAGGTFRVAGRRQSGTSVIADIPCG